MKLPERLCKQAAKILRERYVGLLGPGEELVVAGETGEEFGEARIVVEDRAGDRRTEVSVRVGASKGGEGSQAEMDLALDAAEAVLGDWLEGGREERHPIDFVSYDFEGEEVFVRMRKNRPALEAAADLLLQKEGRSPEEPR